MRIYKNLSVILIFLFISCKQNGEKKSVPEIKECVAEYEGFTDAKIDDFEIQFARRLVNSI